MQNDENPISTTPMTTNQQVLAQRKAFETAVTLRAWNDPAFAEQLAKNPVAAINATFGLELPAELDIQLHHETQTTLHLALPPVPLLAAADDELSENDLERVAGGSFGLAASAIASIVSGAGVGVTVVSAVIVTQKTTYNPLKEP